MLNSQKIGIFSYTFSPNIKKAPAFNSTFRKHSKPKLFVSSTAEEKIYEKLAASFKLRPSLNISNFSVKSCNRPMKTHSKVGKHLNQDYSRTCYTPVLKKRYKNKAENNTSRLKPILIRHEATLQSLEIEGRPCSRSSRFSGIDNFTYVQVDVPKIPGDSIGVEIIEKP